jgi:hypothetical protein
MPAHPRLDFGLEPLVQYIVEVDVRQQGAVSAYNKVANSRIIWGLRIARACLEAGQAGCSDVGITLVIDVAANREPQS